MSRTTGNVSDFPIRCTRSQSLKHGDQPSHDGKIEEAENFQHTDIASDGILARNYLVESGFSPCFRSSKNIAIVPCSNNSSESGARPVPGLLNFTNQSEDDMNVTTELNVTSASNEEIFISSTQNSAILNSKRLARMPDDKLDILCSSFNELAINNNRDKQSCSIIGSPIQEGALDLVTSVPPSHTNSHRSSVSVSLTPLSSTSTPVLPRLSVSCGNAKQLFDPSQGESLIEQSTHIEPSTTEHSLSRDEKIDRLLSLVENNASEMAMFRSDMTSLRSLLNFNYTDCTNHIDQIKGQWKSDLNLVEQKCSDLSSSLDLKVGNLSTDIDSRIEKLKEKMMKP